MLQHVHMAIGKHYRNDCKWLCAGNTVLIPSASNTEKLIFTFGAMHFETKGEKQLDMQEMKLWKLQYTEHFEFALSKLGRNELLNPPTPYASPTTHETARKKAGPDFINFICSYVSPE